MIIDVFEGEGNMIAQNTGPAIILSYLIAGFASFLAGKLVNCFKKLSFNVIFSVIFVILI